MPKIIHRTILLLLLVAMFPPLLVARARALRSDQPRVHLIQDMDNQPKLRAQHAFDLFADDRAMRAHPPGTVPVSDAQLDDHFHRGLVDGAWATDFPAHVPMSAATLERGQERFNIYCAPCHGESGNGHGPVSVRAQELQLLGKATWVVPTAMYDPTVLPQPVGQLFNTITYGIRTMPAYGPQIPEADRWAIVAWVKAIQRSQVANWDELPGEKRDQLEDVRRQAAEEARRAAEEAARRAAEQERNAEGRIE